MSHIPVLLHEVVNILDPKPGEFFVDGTLGGGGYAAGILNRMNGSGRFLGIDWDKHMLSGARERISALTSGGIEVSLEEGNYAELPLILQQADLGRVDGIVLDLGFSSDHVANSGKGFSFMTDEPLLMTYSDDATPLREHLRAMSESELRSVIRTYGEERYAGKVARAIKMHLRKSRIETSGELRDVVVAALPKGYERGRIHPATRTFQAFRIFVNHELENLENFIAAIPTMVRPGARVAIVSFHSLEDRIVKQGFKDLAQSKRAALLTKKPIMASLTEIETNPRSRSAKLRAISYITP